MRISDWSSDVCSSDLQSVRLPVAEPRHKARGVSLLAPFRRPGILLLLPLLLAPAARMLVAPGRMIQSDAGGSIPVRTCSGPPNPRGTMTIPPQNAGRHAPGAVETPWPLRALPKSPVVPNIAGIGARPAAP